MWNMKKGKQQRHGFNSPFVHHFSMASGESSSHLQLGVRMPFMPFANPTWLVMEKSPLFSTKKGTTSTNRSIRPCSSNYQRVLSSIQGCFDETRLSQLDTDLCPWRNARTCRSEMKDQWNQRATSTIHMWLIHVNTIYSYVVNALSTFC